MQPRTFGQLTEDTLLAMGFAGETGRQRDIVEASIRRAHAKRATAQDYSFMRMPRPSTLQLVAGQRSYSLSPLFRAPIYFRLRTTGQFLVEAKSDMVADTGLPLESESGTPFRFELRGQTNVQRQPTTAAVVTIANADAGDNGKTVTVQGEDEDGFYVEETVTLGGSVATTTAFAFVLFVRKDGSVAWDGAITATAGSVTLVTIPASSQGMFYRLLYLHWAPSTADVLEYDFWRLPNDLSNDNDLPSIPAPFSDILTYDALVENAGFTRATPTEVQHWNDARAELEHSLIANYIEGQSAGADASTVHYIRR
jgi:hypothetical protein